MQCLGCLLEQVFIAPFFYLFSYTHSLTLQHVDRRRASVTVPVAFEGIEGYQASIDSVLTVLDKTTQGLCSILSKRLESLFASGHLGCLLCFKLTNMFQFYAATISEVLGRKSLLSVTLFRYWVF